MARKERLNSYSMKKKIIAALAALGILGGSAAGWAWNTPSR